MIYQRSKLSIAGLVIALTLLSGVSLFTTKTASAQSISSNSILLPFIANGAAEDVSTGPFSIDISANSAPTTEELATLAQSQHGDELSALYRCRLARHVSAYRSTPRSSLISRVDQGNGQAIYGYSLHYWDDYIYYVQCGDTFYKYRQYGEVNGGVVCRSFVISPIQWTCDSAIWDGWKSVSPGTPYLGSGTNAYF